MGENTVPVQYSTTASIYQNSYLKTAIDDVLADIDVIEARYPPGADNSMEAAHSRQLLDMCKHILKVADTDILPRFNKGKTLSKTQEALLLAKYSIPVYQYNHLLHYNRKYLLYQAVKDTVSRL
ncbi:MAG: hypothetical protein OJI67_06825, partial [Prosthecobacter sp.]|nr:hypothetical protein [Prosthecobacter sp.]